MSLSQARRLNAAVAIYRYFPVRRCRLIIAYTLDFKKVTIFFLDLKKKIRPSSKVDPAMAGPTGPVLPGLQHSDLHNILNSLEKGGRTDRKKVPFRHVKSLMETITYHCRTRKIRQVIIKNEYCLNLRKKETKHW